MQFNYSAPPEQPRPPHWLHAFFHWLGELFTPIGRALKWVGGLLPDAPYAKILLWTVIAIGAAALLWALYNRARYGEWRIRLRRLAAWREPEQTSDWAPEEASARSWLEEADALAADGRFAEAIHHLLVRSVDDIRRRRPTVVRPALTSRELARSDAIPGRARDLFAAIAVLVEQSLFAGRDVGERDWKDARGAYSHFALATAWRA